MTTLILVLLDAWTVVYGQALLEQLHTYDIERYEVVARPFEEGVWVDCRLTLKANRAGALRFVITSRLEGLEVARDGRAIPAVLGAGGLDAAVRLLAPEGATVPTLLTLRDKELEKGETVTYRLRYRWVPGPRGWSYVRQGRVQTHLSSFWLPSMAHELFEARVTVETDLRVLTAGAGPIQIVPLVVGPFRVVSTAGVTLYLPAGVCAGGLADDLRAVRAKLTEWYGKAGPPTLRLGIETRPAPSYTTDSFLMINRRYLDRDKTLWTSHLAHECSHLWWGHRVPTPVIGRGGTWLREGLAQYSGIKVAGALRGLTEERRLWRAHVRAYLGRVDLRRRDGMLFANEPTLKDATYLDDARVPYVRGALVLRILEHALGEAKFRAALRRLATERAFVFSEWEDFRPLAPEIIDYYAAATRLPDFRLTSVRPSRATIRCNDEAWPGRNVPVLVDDTWHTVAMRRGKGELVWDGEAQRIEIDPERIWLDPVGANNVWERP